MINLGLALWSVGTVMNWQARMQPALAELAAAYREFLKGRQ